MSEEKILNKYIELIEKGYCCACNELNCIDNFPHKKIANATRNLQQENQKLKEVIEEVREYIKGFDIERLHEVCEHNLAEVLEYLLQILDKAKGEDNE